MCFFFLVACSSRLKRRFSLRNMRWKGGVLNVSTIRLVSETREFPDVPSIPPLFGCFSVFLSGKFLWMGLTNAILRVPHWVLHDLVPRRHRCIFRLVQQSQHSRTQTQLLAPGSCSPLVLVLPFSSNRISTHLHLIVCRLELKVCIAGLSLFFIYDSCE